MIHAAMEKEVEEIHQTETPEMAALSTEEGAPCRRNSGRTRMRPAKLRDYETEVNQEDKKPDIKVLQSKVHSVKTATEVSPEELREVSQHLKNFTCEICHKIYSQKGNLKTHMLVHSEERPFPCNMPECSKAFRSKDSLRKHKLAHMGVKLFECEVCKEKFSATTALREHMYRHTGEKPHKCSVCDQAFRQVSCLMRHMVRHSDARPYICGVCGKSFSAQAYLKSHSKVHTGERPYECKTCQKRFAHLQDLNRHKIVHTGEKPYSCGVCGEKFSDRSSRRRHEREHSGVHQYVCQLCGETFTRSSHLKTHLQKRHTDFQDKVLITRSNKINIDVTKDGSDPGMVTSSTDRAVLNCETDIALPLIEQMVSQMCHDQLQGLDAPLHVTYQVVRTGNQQLLEIQYQPPGGDCSTPVTMRSLIPSGSAADQTVVEEVVTDEQVISGGAEIPAQQKEENEEADKDSAMETDSKAGDEEVAGTDVVIETVEDSGKEKLDSKLQEVIAATLGEPVVEMQEADTEPAKQRQSEPASTMGNTTASRIIHLQTVDVVASAKALSVLNDYVHNPDFNSQDYYNWLSKFTEICKILPMPLDSDLFQQISQVQKKLSDTLATPSGILSNKENYIILMNISKDLNGIMSDHHAFVLQNLESN